MKATPQIEHTPKLKSITLELTPREALLLMTLTGNLSARNALDKINEPRSCGSEKSFLTQRVDFNSVPSELMMPTTLDETGNLLSSTYYGIQCAFKDAA